MTMTNSSIKRQKSSGPPRVLPPPPPPPSGIANRNAAQPAATPTNYIKALVEQAHSCKASDIHIRVGEIPRFRIRGQMREAPEQPRLTPEKFNAYLNEILTPAQRSQFAKTKELDTAIFYPGFIRCRVNCFETLMGGAMVLRLIDLHVPSIDELRLPEVLKKVISHSQGLVLVTGPTGSGKSTTMAAMIRCLNESSFKHVISIEDPIEYVHASKSCLISQREVGLHTDDFHSSLRSALREDPDVILIGEMRDRLTINIALQAAQTGHLVLGTLHTRTAISAINRLLNMFNPEEQVALRIQIVETLYAVVAQLLLPTTDGGRTTINDVLINTTTMQDYLYKGDDEGAFALMHSDTYEGMQVMNQDLYRKVMEGRVAIEVAEMHSPDPNELDRLIRTGGFDASRSPRDFA
ncbi:PilT/PilU family type 4a pilus ATPase [Laspinema sp. A4]|uniref:type IV pilus twitching motility protein PilT n=1 Tax=Laspinema sp. D2d TaxID=2953686 RepID=UPI0021BA86AB|nr:PilT/PilU family type 4a pilus ATPase [Laspinema sp. D2d]MCT7986132.1 PilT/PilU family type 4a pilus ATPase [Laspinema sp. D2d]